MTPEKINETQNNKIENTLEQDQYKEYLQNIRINQDDESNFQGADFFSVKKIPNGNTVTLDGKEVNSYIHIQLQQKNKEGKLVPTWKEFPIIVFKNNIYNLDIETGNIELSNKFKIDNGKINLINKKEDNKKDNTKSEKKEYTDYQIALGLDKEYERVFSEDSSYGTEDFEEENLESIYSKEIEGGVIDEKLINGEIVQKEFSENEEAIFDLPLTKPKKLSLYDSMEYDVQDELNNLHLEPSLKMKLFEEFQGIYNGDSEVNKKEKAKNFYDFSIEQGLNVLQATMILGETTREYFKDKKVK